MKIKSTLIVLAAGGVFMAVTAPFPGWSPLAALMFPCTLLGGFAAWIIDNDTDVRKDYEQRKAA
jgi:hypothetical protein